MDKVLNITELAKILKITPDALYRMVSDKTIPHFRVGRKQGAIRFRQNEIDNWIKTQETNQDNG